MMIAITFALPQESRAFIERLEQREPVFGSGAGSHVRGWLGSKQVGVWHLGMGRPRAAAEAAKMFAAWRPERVICAGYGGGLQEQVHLGDVVVEREADGQDGGGLGWGGEPAIIEGVRCHAGSILTVEEALETPEAKARTGSQSGALACDMETAAVRALCANAGVPLLAVRAISDTVHDALPVPMEHWFDLERQRPRVLGLLGYLATHPSKIGPFARFVRGLPPVQRNLATVLESLVKG